MPPKDWVRHEDATDLMAEMDEFDAILDANPAAKYEHLKEIGTIRRACERGCSVEEFESAYGCTVPPEDRWPAR